MSQCKNELVNAGRPAPRTCPTCFPGACVNGITPVSRPVPDDLEKLPDAVSPGSLIAASRSRQRSAIAKAIAAVNGKLQGLSDLIEAGGVPVPFDLCGGSDAIRRNVCAHFEAAGWAVSRSSDESQRSGDLDYVFKARD